MIDRARLAEVAERCRAGEAQDGDLEWLLEQVERLAADNERLSRLVAEITEMVRDARRRRVVPVADDIADALDDSEDGGNGRGSRGKN